MKKIFTFVAALACVMSMGAKTIYLIPGQWKSDDAKFSVYSIATESFSEFLTSKNGIYYEATIADDTQIIFVRHDKNAAEPRWDNKWNQTGNLTVPKDKNCWTHKEWAKDNGDCIGEWSFYDPSILPKVQLAGTMTDWGKGALTLSVAADSLTASTTVKLEADSTYEFKIIVADTWLGNDGEMTRDGESVQTSGWTFESNKNNCRLTTDIFGDYVFTWIFEENKLTVTYPNKTESAVDNVVVEKKATKIIRNGQMYILRNGVMYNSVGQVAE